MFTRFACVSFAVLGLALVGCAGNGSDDTSGDNGSVGEDNITSAKRDGGRFETFDGLDGKLYFRLVAANGLGLLRSEAYERAAGPENAMQSLMKAAAENQTERFQVLPASNGGSFINVVGAGSSNEIIATSEVYSSKTNANDAVMRIVGYLKGIATTEHRPATTGKRFDLVRIPASDDPSQPFRFMVRADNGETVLFSENYTSKQSAQDGIKSVKENGRKGDNFSVSEVQRNGKTVGVFSLRAANSESIGFSELYATKSNAQRGAHAVRDLLQADLDINDLTK